MKEKKKFSFTPEKLWGIAIFVFFAWFIFAFLVFPNLNTVVSVFYQNGPCPLLSALSASVWC